MNRIYDPQYPRMLVRIGGKRYLYQNGVLTTDLRMYSLKRIGIAIIAILLTMLVIARLYSMLVGYR